MGPDDGHLARRVGRETGPGIRGIMTGVLTQRPTRFHVLVGVVYLVMVLALTWLALADPYTYAYWVRFVILFPSSFVLFFFDYPIAVVLFGPGPTTSVATLYLTALAIAGTAMQLALAWVVCNRAK